jgi:biphenyl-2,3-diol 1,2-dioxygenase
MSVAALGYLGFAVSDLTAWDAFATGSLGLMPGEPISGATCYRADELAWRIAFAEGAEDDLAYVGFEVRGPDDLAVLAARLKKRGPSAVAAGTGAARHAGRGGYDRRP